MNMMKWVNTIAFLTMVAINALSNLLPLGGQTTGQIAEAYPSLITPAGMTFAIWGMIYLFLGLFILYQWRLIGSDSETSQVRTKIGSLFAASCVFNILWLLCWHSGAIGWSVSCILLLLITLAWIQFRIRQIPIGRIGKLAVNAAFDLYFGWIIAAAITNISVWLVKIGWNRFGLSEVFWAVIMLLAGAVIGVCVVYAGHNPLAGCALIWAYAGILIKHLSGSGYSGKYPIIIAAAVLGIACILTSVVKSSARTPVNHPKPS